MVMKVLSARILAAVHLGHGPALPGIGACTGAKTGTGNFHDQSVRRSPDSGTAVNDFSQKNQTEISVKFRVAKGRRRSNQFMLRARLRASVGARLPGSNKTQFTLLARPQTTIMPVLRARATAWVVFRAPSL